MFKKIVTTALLVCTVPVLASAWTFTTQATNGGGSLATRNKLVQTSADGAIYRSYSTSAGMSLNVAANTGYSIRSVTVNGVAVTPVPASPYNTTLTGSYAGKKVVAAFVANLQAVTSTMTGGTATPSSVGNLYTGTKLTSALTFTFTPKSGYSVQTVTLNGADATATGTVGGYAVTVVGATNVLNGAVKVTLPANTVIAGPIAFASTATNALPIADAGKAQTYLINGGTVTLTGGYTGSVAPATYTWTQTSGTAVVLTPAGNKASFTAPATAGSLTFKLAVDGGSNAATSVFVFNTVAEAGASQCSTCHIANGIGGTNPIQANWAASVHGQNTHSVCSACHVGTADGAHPGTVNDNSVNNNTFTTNVAGVNGTLVQGAIFCTTCHTGGYAIPHATTGLVTTCAGCHTATGTGDAHSITAAGCTGCHAIGRNAGAAFVQDNNGVRAITGEFEKWSHHVTGVTLNDAHCAACHLEGKVESGKIVTDFAVHMVDNKIHLRDTKDDTDADFAWDPTAPDFTGMDNFCMSCHDANGATSAGSAAIQGLINAAGKYNTGKTASASNPFGDTISNQYDKMERPAVVDAKGQFATGNNSHHAVRGKKYTGRTRVAGSRQIAQAVAFDINSSANLPGKRSTIFDATKFETTYSTLQNAGGETDVEGTLNGRNGGSTLGDDSTLHCGDCHTVGQFRAADVNLTAPALNAKVYNRAVIGAHGSNNEYMLRNNVGTDEKHVGAENAVNGATKDEKFGIKPYLVCYNCHAFNSYNSILGHAGEKPDAANCNGSYNTVGNSAEGEARLLSWNGKTGALSGKEFGNILGIQCANCHNSGTDNALGGIHGSKVQTYADGMGNTTNVRHFLPGLGNSKFVPGTRGGYDGTGSAVAFHAYSSNRDGIKFNNLSGITYSPRVATKYTYTTGGVTSDLNWEQATAKELDGVTMVGAGCYTISPTGSTGNGVTGQVAATDGQTGPDGRELFGNWGGCDDHNAIQAAGDHGFTRKVLRKVTY